MLNVFIIGSNLQLSASKKFFSFYTMLRLDVIKARDPAFSQTQTLLDLEDSQNSQTYFKIGLKIKAKQTLACLTCVQINLVVNYKTGGGQSREVVLPEDYSQDLNNGQWHNLFVGFVYGVAGSDSTGGKTEVRKYVTVGLITCRDSNIATYIYTKIFLFV